MRFCRLLAVILTLCGVALSQTSVEPETPGFAASDVVANGAANDLAVYTDTNKVSPLETGVAVGCGAGCLKFSAVTIRYSGGTFTFQDETPTTGVTQLVLQNGAGQANTIPMRWLNSAGTIAVDAGFRGSDSTFRFGTDDTLSGQTRLEFRVRTSVAYPAGAFSFNNAVGVVATSGHNSNVRTTDNFRPTSGTATSSDVELAPIINQTGGASGITRGLYVNPTLTAAADWRAIEVADGGGVIKPAGYVLANLPTTAPDGSMTYCSDCTEGTAACTGSGTGTMAFRLNGAWRCF